MIQAIDDQDIDTAGTEAGEHAPAANRPAIDRLMVMPALGFGLWALGRLEAQVLEYRYQLGRTTTCSAT